MFLCVGKFHAPAPSSPYYLGTYEGTLQGEEVESVGWVSERFWCEHGVKQCWPWAWLSMMDFKPGQGMGLGTWNRLKLH